MMDNRKLNAFYDEKVKMTREETKTNTEIIIPIIDKILQYVNFRETRFEKQTLDVGSYHTHLKVSRVDEFDFRVVLDVPPLPREDGSGAYYKLNKKKKVIGNYRPLPAPSPGKIFVSIDDETMDDWERQGFFEGTAFLTMDYDVVPITVRRHLRGLVREAVRELKFKPTTVSVSKVKDSPATRLLIDHPSIGYTVNVGICPIIDSKLEFKDKFGFPRQGKAFPPKEKLEAILKHGVNLIAKVPLYWTLSFAVCEKELLKDMDTDGGCRRKCQRIMKKLKEDIWCPKHMKQELTSYHITNALFWECEDHSLPREWSSDMLSTRLETMTKRLLGFLRERKLPLYFYPEVNLLKKKDKKVIEQITERITKFLRNPVKYLE